MPPKSYSSQPVERPARTKTSSHPGAALFRQVKDSIVAKCQVMR